MYYKLISILAVVGHKIIPLCLAEVQDVSYSLGVIPDRIGISGEVNIFLYVSLLRCSGHIDIFSWENILYLIVIFH